MRAALLALVIVAEVFHNKVRTTRKKIMFKKKDFFFSEKLDFA